jgi:hypothetical protein
MKNNSTIPNQKKGEQDLTHFDSCLETGISEIETMIRSSRLESIALIVLELYRPLVLLGDSTMFLLDPLFKSMAMPKYVLSVFRSRQALDELIQRLSNDKLEAT